MSAYISNIDIAIAEARDLFHQGGFNFCDFISTLGIYCSVAVVNINP